MRRRASEFIHSSLQNRLLLVLLLALPLVWIASAAFNLYTAQQKVNELFDTEQAFFAQTLVSINLEARRTGWEVRPTPPRQLHKLFEEEGQIDDDIVFQLRNAQGDIILTDVNYTTLPFRPNELGFVNEYIEGRLWRVLYLNDGENGSYVAVGQRMSSRLRLVWRLALGQMLPWIVALPILLLAMWWGMRQALKPLHRLQMAVSRRATHNLEPIMQRVPEEVQPLVNEINHLFSRLTQGMENERRFTADAAHELRTPLAALRLQIELAQMSDNEAGRERALAQALTGIDRTTRLIEQLLTLARLDRLENVPDHQRVNLVEVASRVMLDLSEAAALRGVEVLPVVSDRTFWLEGSPGFLSILLRNLIDNAIRYSPDDVGRVWLEVDENSLTICDSGPGVSPEWLGRLRERFARPEGQKAQGSGLGLSIAERIVLLHGLVLDLDNHPEGGFRAKISRPKI